MYRLVANYKLLLWWDLQLYCMYWIKYRKVFIINISATFIERTFNVYLILDTLTLTLTLTLPHMINIYHVRQLWHSILTQAFIDLHRLTYTYIHLHRHTLTQAFIHLHTLTYTYPGMHLQRHLYTYIHLHTLTQAYTYTVTGTTSRNAAAGTTEIGIPNPVAGGQRRSYTKR